MVCPVRPEPLGAPCLAAKKVTQRHRHEQARPQTSRPPPTITSMGPRRCLPRAPSPAPSAHHHAGGTRRRCRSLLLLLPCWCAFPPALVLPHLCTVCLRPPPAVFLRVLRPALTRSPLVFRHCRREFSKTLERPTRRPDEAQRRCAPVDVVLSRNPAGVPPRLGSARLKLRCCVSTGASRSRPCPRSTADVRTVCSAPKFSRIIILLA